MTADELKKLIQEIAAEAKRLNAAHTNEPDAPVNYACVFAQSAQQYETPMNLAS